MIIVTGGMGSIGNNIVKPLNDKGITDTLVVDDPEDGIKFANLVGPNIADYMDKEGFLIQIMAGKGFDDIEVIFHEGTRSPTTERDGKYMMDNNYQYSKELLHYCLERETPFLYAFSAATYGGHTSGFIESYKYEEPLNAYGYPRFLLDGYVRQTLPEANPQIAGFCYFNVYGPREDRKDSMANVVFHPNTQLNSGETPKPLEGNESFKRDLAYVGDVAAVNLQFLKNGVSDIFNLGTGRVELFQTAADTMLAYHKKGSIEYIPSSERLEGCYQALTQADLTNLRAAGYDKPFKIVAEGVTEYMAQLNHDTQV